MTEKRFTNVEIDDYYNLICVNDGDTFHSYSEKALEDLLNELSDENRQLKSENKKLEKKNLDLSEELDYYKTKCASLETGLFQADKENEQLRKENKELQGKASSWKITASEQIMEQSKLIKENAKLKQELFGDEYSNETN